MPWHPGAVSFVLLAPLLLVSAVCLQGQSVVSGIVVDAATGKGLSGATALLELAGQAGYWTEAITDNDGWFQLHPAFRGECTFTIEKTGYVDILAANRSARRLVVSDTPGASLSVALSPAGAATGTVFDAQGRPLAGAIVGPAVRDEDSGAMLLGEPHATVDDRGHYGLYGLAPGGYVLVVTPSQSVPAGEIFAPVYFPGVMRVEQATRVRLLAGETDNSVNFVVPVPGEASIRGEIVAAGIGSPPTVVLYSREGFEGPLAYAHSTDGKFAFEGLSPGAYRVTAADGVRFGAADVDLSTADSASVTVRAEAPQPLAGRFEYRAGESTGAPCWRAATIAATPAIAGSWVPAVRAAAARDGSFEFRLYPALSYKLSADGLDGCFVTEIRQHGKEGATFARVDQGAVTVVVSSQMSEVGGFVQGKSGSVTGAAIILAPLVAGGLVSLKDGCLATAGPDGSYRFPAVPAGRYLEIALPAVSLENWGDTEFWKDHRDQAVELVLTGKPVQSNIRLLEPRKGSR